MPTLKNSNITAVKLGALWDWRDH